MKTKPKFYGINKINKETNKYFELLRNNYFKQLKENEENNKKITNNHIKKMI